MGELDRFLMKVMESHPGRGGEGSSGETTALSSTPESSDCPSEELFASYLDGIPGESSLNRSEHGSSLQPSTEEKERMEKHILECRACFEKCALLIEAHKELKAGEVRVAPRSVTEKAKRLLQTERSPFAEVVLKFTRDTVAMVSATTGIERLSIPVMGVTRGSATAEETNFVQFRKEFGNMRVEIVVEKTDNSECDVEVKVSDRKSGRPAGNTRITINSRGREFASYLTDNGQALFREFQIDNYTLNVTRGSETVGSIMLTSL